MSILKIKGGILSSNSGSKFTSNVRSFIDSRIRYKNIDSMSMFSTRYYGNNTAPYTFGATGANFVRSLTGWGSDLNSQLTSISVYSGNPNVGTYYMPNRMRMTLITPRHAIAAKHNVSGASGSTALSGAVHTYSASQRVWIDTNNNPVSAVATHWAWIGGTGDGVVLVLDRDMPSSINRMPIASPFYDKIWETDLNLDVPLISTDQNDKLSIRSVDMMSTIYAGGNIGFTTPAYTSRFAFFTNAVGGDSSNPIMICYNNTLSLVSTYYYGGGGGGPPYYLAHSLINDAIALADAAAGISTGYTATFADFS